MALTFMHSNPHTFRAHANDRYENSFEFLADLLMMFFLFLCAKVLYSRQ